FDPNSFAFVCVANAVMIDLEGIDGLDQICLFTLDVDYVAQIDRTIGQFDDSDVYSRIIVNNTPDERFSYTDSHNYSHTLKFLNKANATELNNYFLDTQRICQL